MTGSANPKNGPRSVSREFVSKVHRAWGESPFYQSRLNGPAPDRLYVIPSDPYTADVEFANSFLAGRMALAGETLDCDGEISSAWQRIEPASPMWKFMHEFAWARHLAALGDDAQRPARAILASWLDLHEKWSPVAWTPTLTGERLLNICAHGPLFLRGGDALWRSRVLTSLARQTRHLANSAHRADSGLEKLMAATALAITGYCLPGCEAEGERGLELVRRETRLQILPDGGHESRNPAAQLAISIRIQSIFNTLEQRNIPAPGFLRNIELRTSAMARFFRVADGRIAVFHGGNEGDAKAVIAAQTGASEEVTPTGYAKYSGYQKLTGGRSLVIFDVAPTQGGVSGFNSVGSFHFSDGRSRMITNCGNGGHLGRKWQRATRAAAAHSTLSFGEGGAHKVVFSKTSHQRGEETNGQLVEFTAFADPENPIGFEYSRRLFLSSGGTDLRGEDRLVRIPSDLRDDACWRFHFHPGIRASLARDRKSVLLALPSREGWRFRASGADISIEKSIYFQESGLPIATEQIVMTPNRGAFREDVDGTSHLSVKWAFKRQASV